MRHHVAIEQHGMNYRWTCKCGELGTWKTERFRVVIGSKAHLRRSKP